MNIAKQTQSISNSTSLTFNNTAINKQHEVRRFLLSCVSVFQFSFEFSSNVTQRVISELNLKDCDQAVKYFVQAKLWPSSEVSPNAVWTKRYRAIKAGELKESDQTFSFSFKVKGEKNTFDTYYFQFNSLLLLHRICQALKQRAKEKEKIFAELDERENIILSRINSGKATIGECNTFLSDCDKHGKVLHKATKVAIDNYTVLKANCLVTDWDEVYSYIPGLDMLFVEQYSIPDNVKARLESGPKSEEQRFAEYCAIVSERNRKGEALCNEQQKRILQQSEQRLLLAESYSKQARLEAIQAQRDKLQDSVSAMIAERNIVLASICALQEVSRKRERKLADYDALLSQIERKLAELSAFVLSCK